LTSELSSCNQAIRPLIHLMRTRDAKPDYNGEEEYKTVYIGQGAYKRQKTEYSSAID